MALAALYPPRRVKFCLVDFQRSSMLRLSKLPQAAWYVSDDDHLGHALSEIEQELRERRLALEEARRNTSDVLDERAFIARYPAIVFACDDFDALREPNLMPCTGRLEQLIRRERATAFHVLLTANSGDLYSCWDPWVKALKDQQTGFLLASHEPNDLQMFNIKLPITEAGKSVLQGQGYYARRGYRARKLQVATIQAGAVALAGWVEQVRQRTGG